MSGSFTVFVWHIRQTLDPTEIKLRVSRCCCPTTPGDTCCVSRPFKLQDEPSGVVADGGIGMLRSWSKLTVEPVSEKDTQRGAYAWSTTYPRVFTPHSPRAAPAGFERLFSIRTDWKSDNRVRVRGCQSAEFSLSSLYPIVYQSPRLQVSPFRVIPMPDYGKTREKRKLARDSATAAETSESDLYPLGG